MNGIQAIGELAVSPPINQQGQTWIHQSVENGSAERFRVLFNGVPNAGEVEMVPETSHSASVADAVYNHGWDDVFHRESLLQELNKMNGVPLAELPAASAKVMVMSCELGMKTQSVRDATKNIEESIKHMLNG